MKWTDADEIAPLLLERFPDTDPLTIRFPDLQRWVAELDGFADEPRPGPRLLETIQRKWYERYEG